MNLLTLDLGVTTGWCQFWVDGQPDDEWGITDYGDAHLDDLGRVLPSLARDQIYGAVILEKPLLSHPGPLQKQLHTVVTMAEAVFPMHISITPSQWKPSTWSRYPLPSGTSQHVRDAVRMGVWWLKSAWDPDTLVP